MGEPLVEERKSLIEHHVELCLIKKHLLNVLFKSIVVRCLIMLQSLDSFDEGLDPHEDWVRILRSELLLELEGFRSIVHEVLPWHLLLVDQEHY